MARKKSLQSRAIVGVDLLMRTQRYGGPNEPTMSLDIANL